MLKKIAILLFITTFVSSSVAQEVKFGKVTKEELMEAEYPNDISASAVILYKKRDTYLVTTNGVNQMMTEIHERIKIYKKEGFDHATEVINLFKNRSDNEEVRKIKAVTHNLENGQIVTTELQKGEIFETEASYNYDQVKFTMPNVKEGSIVEFSYRIISPFIWNIDEFRFQYDIPVKTMHAEIRTPKGFRFKQTPKGYRNVYPKVYEKMDNRIRMEVVVHEFDVNNMPALEAESFVDNIDNYRSGVLFELVSIELPGFYRSFSTSWGDVAKTIGNSDDYEDELDKTKSFDDEIDAIVNQDLDEMGKMKTIFEYVKNNITWNGMDGKYFYNGLKKTLKEKKGNAADINLLLVAMLRYAGIDSNPVIISTKDNLIPLFPTIDRLNYVLAYAVVGDKEYFMDATEEFSDMNVLPIKDYNWRGLLIDNNKMVWKQIDVISPGKSTNLYALDVTLNEDGSSEGSFKSRFDKHSALDFRKGYKDQDLDAFLTTKEGGYSNIEISDYVAKNTDKYFGTVSESFNFFNDYGSDVIDDKLYVKPLGFLCLEENPFKKETREYPIDFGYPFEQTYLVNLNIPEGYQVEYLPESTIVSLPDGIGSFKYMINQRGSKVNVRVNFEVNRAIVSALSYPHLREFFKQVIAKESEQLILSKI